MKGVLTKRQYEALEEVDKILNGLQRAVRLNHDEYDDITITILFRRKNVTTSVSQTIPLTYH
jgi:hypothetical protein